MPEIRGNMKKSINRVLSNLLIKSISSFLFVVFASGFDKMFLHLDISPFSWFILFAMIYFLINDEMKGEL